MAITRRGFFKGALAACALVALRPPFKLPQIGGVALRSYADAVRALKPIAHFPLDQPWDGWVSHCAIFDTALPPAVIADLWGETVSKWKVSEKEFDKYVEQGEVRK